VYWGTDPAGTTATVTGNTGYNPGPVSDGSYYLRLRAQDNAGNWSHWTTLFVLRYDGTAPTGSFTLANGSSTTYTTQVLVSSDVSDNLSGVTHIRTRNAGESWGDWQAYSDDIIHVLPSTNGQTYTVEVAYKDQAGNISPTYSQSILLNTNPGRPSSTNFQLKKSTFGAAAWDHQSTGYQLHGTLAQTSPVGQASSTNHQLISGYWSPVSETSCTFVGMIELQGRSDHSGATFTAGTHSATTDASGNYEITLPSDAYDLSAEMDRYLDAELTSETCPAGETIQLPTVTLLGGDANDDCTIDILDLAFMGAHFGLSEGDANFDAKADINADGTVNNLDLTAAKGNFHQSCPITWPNQ
jgi:hypothetical protein